MESRLASLPFTVLLGVLFALTALGTDAWLPALPVAAAVSAALGAMFDGTARPLATVAVTGGLGAFVLQRRFLRGPR